MPLLYKQVRKFGRSMVARRGIAAVFIDKVMVLFCWIQYFHALKCRSSGIAKRGRMLSGWSMSWTAISWCAWLTFQLWGYTTWQPLLCLMAFINSQTSIIDECSNIWKATSKSLGLAVVRQIVLHFHNCSSFAFTKMVLFRFVAP